MEKTMNYKIGEALSKLRPAAEWYLSGDDYSNLKWLDKNQTQPSWAEVQSAIESIEQEESKAEYELAEKKAAAEAKLIALGLTIDELKALGLG